MDLHITPAVIAIIFTVLSHGIISVWWAAKITENQKHQHDCLHRIEGEIKKRDETITRAHERIDEIILTKGGSNGN